MFNSNGANYSIPVTPFTNNNSGFGFGGNGFDSIIALAILAMIFGWGNGGWGNFGGYGVGQSSSVYEGYVLNNDFSQLSKQISDTYNMTDRKFEGLANGMCSMGYETQGLINGVNTNIMQGTNAIQSQLADCCCKTQTAIGDVKYAIGSTGADLNYNLATQANGITNAVNTGLCQTNFNNATNTRDIIDSQTASTRAILDKLCQMENNSKDERIAELTARNADLRLAASQQAQNAYLVNTLRPSPSPAYVVPNPYCNCNCNQTIGYCGTTIA